MKEKFTQKFLGICWYFASRRRSEGNLITNKDSLEVECLPDDLVNHIEVDIQY